MLNVIGFAVIITIGLIVIFNIIGKIISNKQARNWQDQAKGPGTTIDVDGRQVYVTIKGQGPVTAIIEPTIGSASPEWWQIQNDLAKHMQVITYDRAGYGWSELTNQRRTSENIAEELKKILEAKGIQGPYLLIGHGFGASYLQHFARLCPQEIVGAVFISPQPLDSSIYFKELNKDVLVKSGIDKLPAIQSMLMLNKLGVIRRFRNLLFKSPPLYYYHKLNEDTRDILWQHFCLQTQMQMVRLEYVESMRKGNMERSKKAGGFPDIPVKVLYQSTVTANKGLISEGLTEEDAKRVDEISRKQAQQFLAISSASEWIEVSDSSQFIHLDQPNNVIKIVNEIVNSINSAHKL
ncbi:alpha/beta fold hydrolase [Desulfuribacillus alkaliarsenatis]|uniref:AB hydrolase-1 domain-containing protein n=1 Tax=Desulfuribacillus alkaliarsenatis TaxID=766136 RepID=A0A1E5G1C0_9FIRM|nr:alpha/beta fold hydrolase [Desulfuribacillus alkaliarsenatis]OEF96695.1 hypothetical protein BHF68_06365 [Desulfuribacillus alkaliarsenatis]